MRRRDAKGAGLVEGIAGLMLVITGCVGAVLLLENVGLTIYYKEKVGFIANQAAMYAADTIASPQNGASDIGARTHNVVDEMLKELGLPKSDTVVTTQSGKFVTVTVAVKKLTLAGGGILPASVDVEDRGIAIVSGRL